MKFLLWLAGIFEIIFIIHLIKKYITVLIKEKKGVYKKEEFISEDMRFAHCKKEKLLTENY